MATLNPEFEIDSVVDLDNIDTEAAKKLLARAGNDNDIEVVIDGKPDTPKTETKQETKKPAIADDPTDEELASYSDRVKERINSLTEKRRQEERARLAVERERDEAVAFAARLLEDQKANEARLRELDTQSKTDLLAKLDSQIADAKRRYSEAADLIDGAAMAEIQVELATLAARKDRAESAKEAQEKTLDKPAADAVQRRASTAPAPDARAQEWIARNQAWFQKDTPMTAFVFGVHEQLVKSGVHPVNDADVYYRTLDEEMRRRFPDKFAAESSSSNTRTQPSNVASATRTTSGKRRVVLTERELAFAKKMNVTPEQYAREKLKLENRNG